LRRPFFVWRCYASEDFVSLARRRRKQETVEAKLKKIAKRRGLFSALERSYFPIPLPKLYIVAKHHSLYALNRLVIVGEVHMNRVSELSVAIKDVGSVAGHDR
jgi:hypothetical protein